MASTKIMEKTVRKGIPMSEKQREEHLKAFSDIDLCITSLGSCKTKKKALKCKK